MPDRAIAEVAAATPLGPWIAHVSGATPLEALDPHVRRFGLHPLQTFSKELGPEQLDGAWGAVTAESDEARAVGRWLAETLGLRPFDLDDDKRAAYHAGAAMASNYLVTLRAAAGALLEAAGAPPEALDPLIRGVMDTGFELTGPIARGDWKTVERHLAVIRAERPELEDAAEVQGRFGRLCRDRILSTLDHCCSAHCGPDQTLRIDSIEIDLGRIPRDWREEDVLARIGNELDRRLGELAAPAAPEPGHPRAGHRVGSNLEERGRRPTGGLGP